MEITGMMGNLNNKNPGYIYIKFNNFTLTNIFFLGPGTYPNPTTLMKIAFSFR